MNRPFKPVAPAGVSSPSPIVGTPATPITAEAASPCPGTTGAAREAEARAAPTHNSGAVAGAAQSADGASVHPGLELTTPRARTFSQETAPTLPKQPCLACDNKGEREWLSLDETEWRWHICEDCDGTGYAKKPYCDVCQGNLTADLFCVSCDDWASLTYVERISPTRIAL